MADLRFLNSKKEAVTNLTDFELIEKLNELETNHHQRYFDEIIEELKDREIDPTEYWFRRYANLGFEQLISIALNIQRSSSFQINAALRRINFLIINSEVDNQKIAALHSMLLDHRINRYDRFEKKINRRSKLKEIMYRIKIIIRLQRLIRLVFRV
jgi:hypothetical protein